MIPVILIHRGYQRYLTYVIKQATKNNFVYLIGDTAPNIHFDNFEFIDINLYTSGCAEFTKNYVHLNTTPIDYEIFCYHRWYILRNFMKDKNIDTVFYIDSDVLLFSNVEDEYKKYEQFEMTLLHRTAATSSYFSKNIIEKFCNMLSYIYANKNSYEFKKIASHYNIRKECGLGGGVCDMTLFEFFHYSSEFGGNPGRVGEMMHIINDSVYDHNINAEDQDFEFCNGKKDIKVINKHVYVFNKRLQKDILFNSLHFQGNAKQFIERVYNECN